MKKVFMDSAKLFDEKMIRDNTRIKNGIETVHFNVDYNNEKQLKRIRGDYFSINFNYLELHKKSRIIKKELMRILKLFFQGMSPAKPLILGLGNSSIVCDSLGVNTTNGIMATNHFTDFLNIPKVALFNPEVTEKTGISSFSLIEMVVKKLKPTVIIMIDSLATDNEALLNNCIEVNNTGIISASRIHENKKIDKNTFNIPVIAIGVPLVLEHNKNFYTSPNVKEILDLTSKIISEALNDLFF